ncbi:hypothetical protein, partial [Silvibacterium sp.]|uniref:hypothetical protein n=1 Tax=Silvibacterium sp. TaxID=1964179 RepID=UPI0039E32E1C
RWSRCCAQGDSAFGTRSRWSRCCAQGDSAFGTRSRWSRFSLSGDIYHSDRSETLFVSRSGGTCGSSLDRNAANCSLPTQAELGWGTLILASPGAPRLDFETWVRSVPAETGK